MKVGNGFAVFNWSSGFPGFLISVWFKKKFKKQKNLDYIFALPPFQLFLVHVEQELQLRSEESKQFSNYCDVESRRQVGRPKKTWSKIVEGDMIKLNITEDMAEDGQL